jgi:hypothetical protein
VRFQLIQLAETGQITNLQAFGKRRRERVGGQRILQCLAEQLRVNAWIGRPRTDVPRGERVELRTAIAQDEHPVPADEPAGSQERAMPGPGLIHRAILLVARRFQDRQAREIHRILNERQDAVETDLGGLVIERIGPLAPLAPDLERCPVLLGVLADDRIDARPGQSPIVVVPHGIPERSRSLPQLLVRPRVGGVRILFFGHHDQPPHLLHIKRVADVRQ